MKKFGAILASLLIVTLLAGCSLHYSSMNGISENKMTANEKIAFKFTKGFYNRSRSKQRSVQPSMGIMRQKTGLNCLNGLIQEK
ncbi:MAG: hypothetical protein ACE3JK_05380 [Sporolactobacillus sp.]